MHVLCYEGQPLVCSERHERLAMFMSAYTPRQQELMYIVSVEVLE